MAKKTINIGSSVNKGDGDPLRTAFGKINDNFDEIYGAIGADGTIFNPLSVDSHLLPDTDNTRDLGSPAKRWRDIFVAPGSLYIGDIKLSNDSGTLVVQRVTDAGLVTETPVPDAPGVVTTDRLVNGVNTFVLKDDGTVELNGEPFGFSGSYDDLTDKPTIPTDVSDLTDTEGLLGGGGGGAGDTLTHAASGNTATIGNNTFQLNIDNGDGSDIQYSLNAQGKMTLTPGEESYTDAGVEVIGNTYTIQANTSVSLLTTNSDPNPATANTATFSIGKTGSEINLTRSGESGWIRNWQFKTDGILTLPYSNYLETIDVNLQIGSQGVVTIRSDAESSGTTKSWVFDKSGTLTTPLMLPLTFTAVLDTEHMDAPTALSDDPWEYGVEFQVNPDGTVQAMLDDPVRSVNPGYADGKSFTFTEADHGIPGYTFNLTLTTIVNDNGDFVAEVAVNPPPEYPSTVASEGAIKLTADAKSFVFGTDGTLTLPQGGDILDSTGNSVLGGGGPDFYNLGNSNLTLHPTQIQIGDNLTGYEVGDEGSGIYRIDATGGGNEPFGTFSTLPDFLDFHPHTNVKAGQNSQGIFFSGDNIDDEPYVSYPVRTNFSINGSTKVVVTVDMTVNSECSDFGICVFEDGVNPQWNWDPDTTRIAAQYDCTIPLIYGGEGQVSDESWQIPEPGTYRVRFTYDPNAQPNVTLETLDTGDNVLSTITLNEVLNPANSYRIGFSADQDDDKLRTYINNLTIAVNGGETYTDSLQLGNGVDGLSGNIITDAEVEGDTRYELNINEDITLTVYQGGVDGNNLGPGISLGQSIGEQHRAGVVAIGNDDVGYNSKAGGVYIGYQAGWNDAEDPQGEYAIAIGARAARNFALDNSITLNATGVALDPDESGLFIKPIREEQYDDQILFYNPNSGEVTYGENNLGNASLTDDKEVKVTVGNTEYFALVSRAQQGGTYGVSPQAVAYDADGNMITLHISNYDVGNDKLIISKFSDTGELSWQQQLNNHEVDTSVSADLVIIDDNSMVITFTIDSYGETGRDSIAVMRLDAEGGLVWSKVLTGNEPVEIIESVNLFSNSLASGNHNGTDYDIVYVDGNYDIAPVWTLQESTDNTNWTTLATTVYTLYNSNDNVTALFVAQGSVAGLDYPTKSYRLVREGVNSWHETSAIATDGDDVFVIAEYEDGAAGPNLPKSAILKLAGTNGNLIWAKVLEVPGAVVEIYGADVGADGHIVAVGYYDADNDEPPVAGVNKFDGTTGAYIWGTAFSSMDGIAGGDIVVDSQNNVFVTLNTREIIMNENSQYAGDQYKTIAYIVKIDSDGDIVWSRRAGPGPCASVASGIDCDSTGNVYLSVLTVTQDNATRTIGDFFETGRTTMALAKYSTTGEVLWQRYIDSDHYYFIGYDDIENSNNDYDYIYNRARNLSLGPNGKLAIQGSVLERDSDGNWYGNQNKQGVVLQIDQDGREMTIGSGSDKFTVKASRIPGKFVTLDAIEGSAEGLLSDLTEDVLVVTPTLTFADAELAQVRSTSAAYEYVFGNDGTLSIPNDGDIRLTQTQIGWFSVFGKANNYNDDIWFRSNCVDPETGDIYAVGQEDDGNQGIVVRYNSQGQVVWSIRLYDNDNENNTRCNSVKIHPTNGNIVVLCEYYGNQTGALFLQIDPETARVVVSTGFRDAGEGGDAIPYDFTFDSAGNIIVVGRKWDEYRQISVTPETGSTTSTLIINKATVTEGPLPIDNTWYMYGTGITGRTTIQYVNRYTGLTGTVNQGTGTNLTLDIDYSNTTNYSGVGVYNFNGGSNYTQGDVITVPGTSLGGATPTNDLTITVDAVDGSGTVTGYTLSGTAQDTTVKIQIVEAVDFSGEGSWSVAYALGGEAFIYKADDEFGYVWSKVLSAGQESDTERYLSVAVGSDNAIYAVGEMVARNNVAGADLNDRWCAVVSKFTSDGTHAWTKALNTALYDSYAKCVSVQGTNTVVVSHQDDYNGNTIITKLDAAGNIKWQRGTYSGDDSSVAVDTNGDIYAVTEAYFENRYENCIKLIKFNAAGEIVYRKFFGTLVYDYGGTNEYFKNGRNLTLDTDNLYISGYTTAFDDNYENGFLVKLPKDASCEGSYSGWVLQNDIYDVVKVTATEATTFAPVIGTGEFENWTPDFATNWWDPSDNSELHTLAEIVDRDGGAIEFADGTRQTSSAQQIPQRKIFNGADHRLQPEDSGRHIFVTNIGTDIIVPYDADSPLPIGFTVVVINDSGGTMNIDADGGGINIRNTTDGNTATYYDLASWGMATLIKVDTNYWYISGNVSVD